MKSVLLIYNPKSGNTTFKNELDEFLEVFNKMEYDVRICRTLSKLSIDDYIQNNDMDSFDFVFVAGGDGTVNEVINSLQNKNIDIPIGIIPAGTANDFARYLNIPFQYDKCFDVLSQMKVEEVDLGKVNDKYFINICCGGLFTNVSQNIDVELKNTLGKMAYYIKGAEQLPTFKPTKLKITTDYETYVDEFILFVVLNSTGAGGFDKLSTNANISDGLFEFIGVRSIKRVTDVPRLLMNLIIGEHLDDKNILYLKKDNFGIECVDPNHLLEESDIDGESGPQLPLDIKVIHKGLRVISNRNN